MSTPTSPDTPAEDASLVALFERLLPPPAFAWEWVAAPPDANTHTAKDAAAALGIADVDRIAKTLIVRWKLYPSDGWNYMTVFVPGCKKVDVLALQHALRVCELELAPQEDAEAATGFSVGAMPPVVLPAVVDERLLHPDVKDGEVYVSGLTKGGLYRLTYHAADAASGEGDRSGNERIFEQWLGNFDRYFPEPGGRPRSTPNDWYTLDSPWVSRLAEPILNAIMPDVCAVLESASDGHRSNSRAARKPSHFDLWKSLFNWGRDFNDWKQDVLYWQEKKERAKELHRVGDNPYFARFCDALIAEFSGRELSEADRLRRFFAATNFMLVVKIGPSSRMLFPMSLGVYERHFFPFLRSCMTDGWEKVKYGPWDPAATGCAAARPAGRPEMLACFLARREMLSYARLTQYTQLDITYQGSPLGSQSKSQTGTVLREGNIYINFPDIISAREKDRSAGQEVDDELGIRCNFYMRLHPPGLERPGDQDPDRVREQYAPRVYLFGYSPFPHWFNPRTPSSSPSASAGSNDGTPLRLAEHLQQRAVQATSAVLVLNNYEYLKRVENMHVFGRFTSRARRETDLQAQIELLVPKLETGLPSSANSGQITKTDALEAAAQLRHALDTNRQAASRHDAWLRIMTSYVPTPCTLDEIVAEFRAKMIATTRRLQDPRVWADFDSAPDFRVRTHRQSIARVIELLWENIANHTLLSGQIDRPAAKFGRGFWPEEQAAFISIENPLAGRPLLPVERYAQLRERVPVPYPKLPPGDKPEHRGLGLSLVHLALETVPLAQAGSPDPDVFMMSGLKRDYHALARVGADGATLRYAVRPAVEFGADGASSPLRVIDIRKLWTTWEVRICFVCPRPA